MLSTDNKTRNTTTSNVGTIDSILGGYQNGAMQQLSELKYAPYRHTRFCFVGQEAPTATTYPDSVAPIGSEFKWLETVQGEVIGFHCLVKVAAQTWVTETGALRTVSAIGTGVTLDGDVTESETISITGCAAGATVVAAGIELDIGGTKYTVVQGGTITATAATVVVDAKVTAVDTTPVSVADVYNAYSHDTVVVLDDGSATTTINLPPVAASAGVTMKFINNLSGSATLDPSGAELIDGGATLAVLTDTTTSIFCDGVEWVSL